MDTKRRMYETRIWEQEFFIELSPSEKLFYWFIITKCDNVGVYVHSAKLSKFHIGDDINVQQFLEKVNINELRIETLSDNKFWIRDIVRTCWGTIAARNNLGLSCYKLFLQHKLLERFIAEFPNHINIESFRDAIEKKVEGYADLPLPQSCPKADPDLTQGKDKSGTINNTYNGNYNISKATPINNSETPLDFEKRSKAFPKHLTGEEIYKSMGLDKDAGELPFK